LAANWLIVSIKRYEPLDCFSIGRLKDCLIHVFKLAAQGIVFSSLTNLIHEWLILNQHLLILISIVINLLLLTLRAHDTFLELFSFISIGDHYLCKLTFR
jgi:hypothetical protein